MLGNKFQGEKGKQKRHVWEVQMEENIKTEKSYTEQDFKIVLFRQVCL